MDQGYRSFSSMHIQSSRDHMQPVRPIITSELIEYSSLISILQLFLNFEGFFKKICETSPSPAKFSGKIKKMLMNFKSENFTGISTIVPSQLRLNDQKPGFILNKILEDFKSCTEIPYEKRPDSLFYSSNGEFTIKVPASRLIDSRLSEILDSYPQVSKNPTNFIVLDIIYDVSPTCEKLVAIFMNLSSCKAFELNGLVASHGCFTSAFIRSFEQWRSFNDGKIHSWVNLVWSFLTGVLYPTLIVLAPGGAKSSPCFLSKIDQDNMLRFSKAQDLKIKVLVREDYVKESYQEILAKPVFEKVEKSAYEPKSYESSYERRFEPREKQRSESERKFERKYSYETREPEKKPVEVARKEEDRIKEIFESKALRNGKIHDETDSRQIIERYREKVFPESRKEPENYREKLDSENKKELESYREKLFSENKKDQEKEYVPSEYRKTMQDFRPQEGLHERYSKPEVPPESRFRNYSTEPSSKVPAVLTARPYKEDLIYSTARTASVGPKELSPRPGILKNPSSDSRFSRFPSGQIGQNTTPMLSPRDAASVLSRTFRETALPDRYEEETTEKPNSILRNSWMTEKDLSRSKYEEKKVNFSDSVFHIEDSNKDQMPEIKLASIRITEKKPSSQDYKVQITRAPESPEYRRTEVAQRTSNYLSSSNVEISASKADTSNWMCPKCSTGISNTLYECNNCRFINWDRFYSLKSKSPKVRSESIPVKNSEREDYLKTYRPNADSRYEGKFDIRNSPAIDSWKKRESEIKVQETYAVDDRNRRSREFAFNR